MPLPQPMVGLIATIVGIAIPFVVLYFSLASYDSRFKDKKLFFSLLFSLVLGTIITLFHISFSNLGLIITWFLPTVLGLTLLEFIIREFFMRLKRFRDDRGIPFYGLTFGLGVGAMIIFGRVYTVLLSQDPTAMEIGALGLFAVAVTFVHGGLGMEAGRRPRDTLKSILWQVVVGGLFNLGLVFFYIPLVWPEYGEVDVTVVALLAMTLVLGFMYFRAVHRSAITAVIPKDDEKWADYPGGDIAMDKARRKSGDDDEVDVSLRRKGIGGKKRRGEGAAPGAAGAPRRQPRRTHRADRHLPRTKKTPSAKPRKKPAVQGARPGGTAGKGGVDRERKRTKDRPAGQRGGKKKRPARKEGGDHDMLEIGGEGDVEYLVLDGKGKKRGGR